MRVHFQGEAWQRDYAIPVDDQGPDSWEVTPETAATIRAGSERWGEHADFDFVREDGNAPEWVREWSGPFTISVLTDDDSEIDYACAECGTTEATTYVVTFMGDDRTEVCRSCDDALRAGEYHTGPAQQESSTTEGAAMTTTRFQWQGWETETDLGNADDRADVHYLTIANEEGEELAVIMHRTVGGKYPLDGPVALAKQATAQRIVDALNAADDEDLSVKPCPECGGTDAHNRGCEWLTAMGTA